MFTRGGVNTHNPQATELTLTLSSVAVGVLPRFNYCLFRYLKSTATSAVITFGSF